MSITLTVRLPSKDDARWGALVTRGTTAQIKLLSLKLMLSRMNQDVTRDSSSANVRKNVDELQQFFLGHARIVQDDAALLFG